MRNWKKSTKFLRKLQTPQIIICHTKSHNKNNEVSFNLTKARVHHSKRSNVAAKEIIICIFLEVGYVLMLIWPEYFSKR